VSFIFNQFVTGLASASSLFLAACGLSIIFGVTRIVNFAHGAFYMLGAYVAFTLTDRLSGGLGFWAAIVLASLIVAAAGAIIEVALLRRIYRTHELLQLLLTFGVTLVVEDVVVLIWGPADLLGPRAPGFKGATVLFGEHLPTYDLLLIALGPLTLIAVELLLRRTRWGTLVRAATQDREMVAALGVNQKWLFTGVFALGVFLAALGGALELPRQAASHTMDLAIITEVLVVVVIGGLGSVLGTFLAAIIVSELNAFGILIFPKISLVLVFLVMAVVLVLRPWGLLGRAEAAGRVESDFEIVHWRPLGRRGRILVTAGVAAAALLPLVAGDYALAVLSETMIFMLFAASLQLLAGAGGIVSFGHAAYFGLGAYGAALALKLLGLSMTAALAAGVLLGFLGALAFGWFCVRLSGVYFAMLTLAVAQIVWSVAFQWTEVTGGDNGLIGVWPSAWAATASHFYWLTLGLVSAGIVLLRVILFSPFGYALRAVRDSELRAAAIGLSRHRIQWIAFAAAGTFAALGGALHAFLKGSVFPDNLAIPTSIDGLTMVLLGGIGMVSGGITGAALYKSLSIFLISQTDYSKLVLGLLIIALVSLFPQGVLGAILAWRSRWTGTVTGVLGHMGPDTSRKGALSSSTDADGARTNA
jgi:branched-chain amino acid transport system permease protein